MSPDPAAQPTSLEYEQQMTKRVLRKLDLHVLPPLAVVSGFLCAFHLLTPFSAMAGQLY